MPQQGDLYITTEFGKLHAKPTEIVVIPRGIKFKVEVVGYTRGYVCEIFKGHFQLPELGRSHYYICQVTEARRSYWSKRIGQCKRLPDSNSCL